ncbi:MAG: TetR/AcrR family transcriptional regulator [Planctomycetota bacterium]
MRYPPEHKPEARERILRAASRQFRERGVARTTVASVMHEADLTHGGFYAHFDSKNDLVDRVIESSFDQTSARFAAKFDELEGDNWVRAWVRGYLDDGHLNQRRVGCPFPSVSAELTQAGTDPQTLRRFEGMYLERIEALIEHVDAPPEEARRRALAATAQMIGALMLARGLGEAASRALRRAAGDEAIRTLTGAPPAD